MTTDGSSVTGRRGFLVRLAALVLGVASTRCGSRAAMTPEEIRERARALDPRLDCSAAERLWPAEARTRTDNEYVDESPHELRFCFNCTNFVPPPGGAGCGSCTTVKGPINPGGWCKAWTERRA